MDSFDYVIVGSGPAGVAAARILDGRGVCIVDVGESPDYTFAYASLGEALASGNMESLLGPRWEMLANLVSPGRTHAKLRAPGVNYVTCGEAFTLHDATGECRLRGAGSYAAGGMSNAWGAQLVRYTDADLEQARDWPFGASALESYYTDLETHIGIAGLKDDMHEFLGNTACMLPPAPIVPAAQHLLSRYAGRRATDRSALRLGRPRLALLTQPYRGYEPFGFGETEFFSTTQSGIYTARRTLEELRSRAGLTYFGDHQLVAYREMADHVEMDLRVRVEERTRTIRARHLLLGCGTIHTARLVLLNKQAFGVPLPFIDHPPTLLPVFVPRTFGSPLPEHSFPVQLVATLDGMDCRSMISFYYAGGMLWSDLLTDMPLPLDASLRLLPNLLGGMLVAQIWETSRPTAGNCLRLNTDGSIRIEYPIRPVCTVVRRLLRTLRKIGAYSSGYLASMSPPGWGFHYAGCLPMRRQPRPYETHPDGRLWDSRRVRVIDGCALPSLPAKNHSLTLMANAARIADESLRCGY